MRTYAQLTTSFVVFCNRVGVDESISFWGGSEVIAPTGEALFSAPFFDEGLFLVDVDLDDVRRERIALPLLRDERLELQVRELVADRRRARRPAPRLDRRAGRGAGPRRGAGRSRAASDRLPPRRPAGPRTTRRPAVTWPCSSRPVTAPLFELPAELAIDTDVARRVIAEFIRGQLRQAGFERAVLGLSGGIDSALVAYLVAEAIGAGAAAVRADAVPHVVARVARRRRGGRRGGSAARASSSRSRRWSTATSRGEPGAGGRDAAPARQLHGPPADGRALRPLGDVGRARRRDRQQDRVADRLHDALRRQRLRVQPDRRPVQEPGPPAGRRDRRARGDHPQGADRPTSGRARPTRARAGSRYPVLDRLLYWRIDKRRSTEELDGARLRSGARRAGGPDGRGRRVQAPGAADREARAADGRRRLPVPAAAARAPPAR